MAFVKVALEIPSGKLVCANDLRYEFPLDTKEDFNINETVGIKQTIEAYAQAGMFHGFVGNSCPSVYKNGNKLTVVNPKSDDDYEPIDTDELGVRVGGVITDLWWYSIADYDEYIARGGEVDKEYVDVIDVEPGRYVLSHDLEYKDYDPKNHVIYATIEKSDEEIVPWKMPEENAAEEIFQFLPDKYKQSETIRTHPDSWRPDLDDSYRFHTLETHLYVRSKYKRLNPDDEYPSKYEKIGFEVWGPVFDGEVYENHLQECRDVFVNVLVSEDDILDRETVAKKVVEQFEIKKAFDDWKKKEWAEIESWNKPLTEEQNKRLEEYFKRTLEVLNLRLHD